MNSLALLKYYEDTDFNPVLIPLESQEQYAGHYAKRRNLYERHLGIPLALLRGANAIEFGCNSGENSLVLADAGAQLTLVEPHSAVHERLRALYRHWNLEDRVAEISDADMASYSNEQQFDLVVAEGFLWTLPNRDELLRKMASLLAPGGLAIISYNDRYGCLLEMTRRYLWWRACDMARISDVRSEAGFELAHQLFGSEFARLATSRDFASWWKDNLLNPVFPTFWSLSELLPVIAESGCEFYSGSPKWGDLDSYRWYKSVPAADDRHSALLQQWRENFTYLLTGECLPADASSTATNEVVVAVADVVGQMADATLDGAGENKPIAYPAGLSRFLKSHDDAALAQLDDELGAAFELAEGDCLKTLLEQYSNFVEFPNRWGVPYQYICFSRPAKPSMRRDEISMAS